MVTNGQNEKWSKRQVAKMTSYQNENWRQLVKIISGHNEKWWKVVEMIRGLREKWSKINGDEWWNWNMVTTGRNGKW